LSCTVIESPTITLTESQQRALENLPPRVADALLRFRDNLLARFPGQILCVILYGSFARGETHGESDVDVMVVVAWEEEKLLGGWYRRPYGDPRWEAIADMAYDATLECNRYVSAFVVGEMLFREGRDAIREARREGIELYHHPSVSALMYAQTAPARVLKDSPTVGADSVDPGDLEDIRIWLSLADENLQVAHYLFKGAYYRDVISSAYYAMFYAAKAALLAAGVSVKSHEGAISEFGRLFAATRRVEAQYGRMLAERYKERLGSDYAPRFSATQELADKAIRDAEAFIAKTRELVEEELSKRGASPS